jgi:cyanophycin synthetase
MTDVLSVDTPKVVPPKSRHAALPLVAVAGVRGKSTIVWILERMLRSAGRTVGVWSSTGVYVQGERQTGELGPWTRVLEATQSGELDVAVQELETALVNGVGLPEQIYPLAAISTLCGNNEECVISPEASLGARAQAIVARAVRPDGVLVLNGDDNGVLEAGDHTSADIVLFALHHENPALRRHLRAGKAAVWVRDGRVIVGTSANERHIIDVAGAHFTLDGTLTFQVQNLLCAVALAVGLGLPDSAIREGLREFEPDPARLPGSCNIFHVRHSTVIVDSARQVWTLRSLARGIRHQPHRRMITVSGCFPHLNAFQVVEAGRILGRLGGAVILHAEEMHRDNIDLMIDGIAQNEVPPLVLSMPGEQEAFDHALRMVGENSLCLLITEDVDSAVAAIERLDRSPSLRPQK